MNSVFIIWQDPTTKMWHPVAQLTAHDGDIYTLDYTNGAAKKGFMPFPAMTDLKKTYISHGLFPFFKNRILPESRPEFADLLNWSGLTHTHYNPLELLGVSGGERKTDNFRIAGVPEKGEFYQVNFFISGIRYLNPEQKARVLSLNELEKINYQFEDKNNIDHNAILLLSVDNFKIGYYPKYLNFDCRKLIDMTGKKCEFNILKINLEAPDQYKILCQFQSPWPEGFEACKSEEYLKYTLD